MEHPQELRDRRRAGRFPPGRRMDAGRQRGPGLHQGPVFDHQKDPGIGSRDRHGERLHPTQHGHELAVPETPIEVVEGVKGLLRVAEGVSAGPHGPLIPLDNPGQGRGAAHRIRRTSIALFPEFQNAGLGRGFGSIGDRGRQGVVDDPIAGPGIEQHHHFGHRCPIAVGGIDGVIHHRIPAPGLPVDALAIAPRGRLDDRITHRNDHRGALVHLGLEAPTPFDPFERDADIARNEQMPDREEPLEHRPRHHAADRPGLQGEGFGQPPQRDRGATLPGQGRTHAGQRDQSPPEPGPFGRRDAGIAQPPEDPRRPIGFQKDQRGGHPQQREPHDVVEEDEVIDPVEDQHQHHAQKPSPPDQEQSSDRQIEAGPDPTDAQCHRRRMHPPFDHSGPIVGQQDLQARHHPGLLQKDPDRIAIDHPVGVELGHARVEVGDHQLRPQEPDRPERDQHRARAHRLRRIDAESGRRRQKRHEEEHQQLEVVVAHPVGPRGLHGIQVAPGEEGQQGRDPVTEPQAEAHRSQAQEHSDSLDPGRRQQRQPTETGIGKMEGHLSTGIIDLQMRAPAGGLGGQKQRDGLQQHHQPHGHPEQRQGLRGHRAIEAEGRPPRRHPLPPSDRRGRDGIGSVLRAFRRMTHPRVGWTWDTRRDASIRE